MQQCNDDGSRARKIRQQNTPQYAGFVVHEKAPGNKQSSPHKDGSNPRPRMIKVHQSKKKRQPVQMLTKVVMNDEDYATARCHPMVMIRRKGVVTARAKPQSLDGGR